LASSASDDELRTLFAQAGDVLEAWIVRDTRSGTSLGYGFVIMSAVSEADTAVSKLNHSSFHGLALKVSLSRARPVRGWNSPWSERPRKEHKE
jgi:RNA recognition motif-containing protein